MPAVVDFAAMRDAVKSLGGDPEKINPICPADLVIDHSVQVDVAKRWVYLSVCLPVCHCRKSAIDNETTAINVNKTDFISIYGL